MVRRRTIAPHAPGAADVREPHACEVLSALAIGAPEPTGSCRCGLERMIHFIPPHNEKIRAKLKETIAQVDVVLGNLEDAIAAGEKEAARRGFISMARSSTSARRGCGRASTA